MIKNQRQNKLLELLKINNLMSVSELAEILNTSKMTVRRDLEYFEQSGLIQKIHGGAILTKGDNVQSSFQERIVEYSTEKQRIGIEATKLIKEGSIVFFDSGTTPLAIVENIPDHLNFTAITTGLATAIALCNKPNVNVVSIGGDVHCSSYTSMNHLAVEMIEKLNADLAFISTKAFSIPEGTYESLLPLIEIKRAIVSVSKKVVLVADHSKFENKSLCLSIPMSNIDMIITDDKTPQHLIGEIENIGKEIVVV